ncbi:pentatricopeptide repeat-containing protein [Pyrus ussuriensis x Pyrus communis]|uniref:Pentatricopeptide repeat-containing protein n=1 Tax=Pyrus ussuriensis x Pyrus communis TaxID=2448454 RepID=A0A5N5FC71_9ROSA|nr:pentatricopeptide repeat-containing protein [Pyrus ussuriensis x Pyrus communis]
MIVKHGVRTRPYHALAPAASEIPSLPSTTNKNYRQHHSLLPQCKSLKSLRQIHAHLIVSGFQQDHSTLTHLINSYSLFKKCGSALSVFCSAQNPSVILWNSMIRAYTRAKQYSEARKMYNSMVEQGVEPDKYTFNFFLKACTSALDFEDGVLVHREVARKRLDSDVFIGTSLIDMYCKMGDLESAREVFNRLPKRDVVACNALIAGLSQSEDPCEALGFFRKMQTWGLRPNLVSLVNLVPAVSRLADIDTFFCSAQNPSVILWNSMIRAYTRAKQYSEARKMYNSMVEQGVEPDKYTFNFFLKACTSALDFEDGVLVHREVARKRLDSDVFIGTSLIDMYCKMGDLESAREGYASNGCFVEVLELFDWIKGENTTMNKVSIISALLAATKMRDLEKGKVIHFCASQQELNADVSVATSIMTMYAKCGEIEKAKQIFEGLGKRDLVSWAALLSACVQSGYPEAALSLFRDEQNEILKPGGITLISVLLACAELSYLKLGMSMHCYALKANIASDISFGTALVSMYAKCGIFTSALTLFNRMPCKDIVTWNALINAYTQIGDACHAIDMFRELWLSGITPDAGTLVGIISACSILSDLDQGTCIHGQIIKNGCEHDVAVKNALISMYCKCNVVSWNAMMSGYVQAGYAREAISAFHQMKLENVRPNLVTFVCILPAVAYLAAPREGMAFHSCIIQMGFLSNTVVGNSLIDMYAKCGQLNYSEKCFNEMEHKDKVSWNAMLAAYAVHGQGVDAVALFSLMQESSVQVDSVSFISVLSACRHAGLVQEGRSIFQVMHEKHCLEPELEHYACMVDLLGRAGLCDEALNLINTMPMEPDAGVWGALLGACRVHSNVELGEIALSHLVKLEPRNAANYIVLSDIHAHSARWGDSGKTRSMMSDSGLKRTPGCSWIAKMRNRIKAVSDAIGFRNFVLVSARAKITVWKQPD